MGAPVAHARCNCASAIVARVPRSRGKSPRRLAGLSALWEWRGSELDRSNPARRSSCGRRLAVLLRSCSSSADAFHDPAAAARSFAEHLSSMLGPTTRGILHSEPTPRDERHAPTVPSTSSSSSIATGNRIGRSRPQVTRRTTRAWRWRLRGCCHATPSRSADATRTGCMRPSA